jgi:hypothetical protein
MPASALHSRWDRGAGERRGEGPALEEDDLTTFRKLARRQLTEAASDNARPDSYFLRGSSAGLM